MDLALLRLDAVAAVTAGADGQAGAIQVAHLLPRPLDGHNWAIIEASHPGALNLDFAALVASLEEELAQVETAGEEGRGRERAILIGVTGKNRAAAADSMEELAQSWPGPPAWRWRPPSSSAGPASIPAFSWARAV